MQPTAASTDDPWRGVRGRRRMMRGLWFGACPFFAIDILVFGHRLGISAAFFLMLAYLCAFIVATARYFLSACPMCGSLMRFPPGSGAAKPFAVKCRHCGGAPVRQR